MSTFGCPRIFSLNAFAANPRWRARAAHAKCERNTRAIRRNTDSTVAGDCLTSLLCLWAAAANRASARIAAKAPLPGGEAELTFGAHFSAPNNDNSCPMTFFGKARNIFFIFDIGSVSKGRVSFSVQQSSTKIVNSFAFIGGGRRQRASQYPPRTVSHWWKLESLLV